MHCVLQPHLFLIAYWMVKCGNMFEVKVDQVFVRFLALDVAQSHKGIVSTLGVCWILTQFNQQRDVRFGEILEIA